jgi:hypothetical protein
MHTQTMLETHRCRRETISQARRFGRTRADIAIGENSATFAEDRASTFQRYLNAVPANFQTLAQLQATYRIVSPSAGGFDTGGPYQTYYNDWILQLCAVNGITIPLAIPNGDGLGQLPDLSAVISRHVGGTAGTFNPDRTLKLQSLWETPAISARCLQQAITRSSSTPTPSMASSTAFRSTMRVATPET